MYKPLLLFVSIIISSSSFAQLISVSQKAKALQYSILTKHVLTNKWNDSLSERVNTLFLNFLDPLHLYFSNEQVQLLSNSAIQYLSKDLDNQTTNYLEQVKISFKTELKKFHTFDEINKLTIQSKTTKQLNTFEKNVPKNNLIELRKNYTIKQMFNDLYYSETDVDSLSEAEINKKIDLYKEKTKNRYSQIIALYEKDDVLIEEAYLNSISLSVDPHSSYFSKESMKSFKDELSNEIERFGFSYSLNEKSQVVISDLTPGSSAWLSGKININDPLIEIGILENKKWKFIQISQGLIGLNDLKKVFNDLKENELKLVIINQASQREEIHLIKTKIFNEENLVKNLILQSHAKIGYIQLPDFYTDMSQYNNGNGCANDIAKCILKLKKDSIQGLILDLRGNGGGSLKEAIELTGIFIDYGPVLGIYDRNKTFSFVKDNNRGFIYNGPLIILIDENSASASEVVSGALQDYGKALIFGRNSFGKATSQQTVALDPISNLTGKENNVMSDQYGYLNVTEGVLYRVNSESNQKNGVIPDIQTPIVYTSEKINREKDLIGAIEAPLMLKKIVYPKTSTIPLVALQTWMRETTSLKNFTDINVKFRELESIENSISKDEHNYTSFYKKMIDFNSKTKAIKKEATYYLSSENIHNNSFDLELYRTNEILRTFQNEFKNEVMQDFELKIAEDLMQQWITLTKK